MPAHASYNQGDEGRSGDFESLVDLHYGTLFRFAMTLTRSEADAADLVQDTFLTWANKGHQLQDRSKAKPWLLTALHRHFLQTRRRAARFEHVELSVAQEELPRIDAAPVTSLDARTALELLRKVDSQYQAALSLFYLEDFSYAEIAEILQVPVGTVKSRIARGLSQLKALVQKPPLVPEKEVL